MLVDQMMRAAKLDKNLYEEVEADTTQTQSALIVVVLAALAAGIGTALGGTMMDGSSTTAMPGAAGGLMGLVGGIIASLVSFAVWTGLVYLIGTRFFGGVATWGEVLRTVGFANSPGVLSILSFIPVLGGLVAFAVAIWTIFTSVVAVRQSLDISTGNAIVVSIISVILGLIVAGIIAGLFAIPMAMGSALGR